MADLENRIVWQASNTDKAIKAITDVEKASQKAVKANTDIAASAIKADKALSKIDGRNLIKAGKSTDTITQGLKEAEKAAIDLDTRLDRLDTNFSKVSQQVGQAGDIESNIRAIGGGLGTIPGGAGIGVAAGAGAEVFAVVEALPRLKTAMAGLPDILQASAKGAGLGGLAGGIQSLVPALGATGASVAALTIVALPLIAAVGTLAIGMKELDKRNREAAEGVRLAAEARQIEADTEREFAQLSVDEQVAERNRLFEERAFLAQRITDENAKLAETQQALDDSSSFGLLDSTRSARDEQKKVVDELITQAAEAGVALQVADDAIGELSQAELNAASFRVRHAEELTAIQGELTQVESQRAATLNQLEVGQNRVLQLETQAAQIREQFAANEARLLEDRTIAETRELEDRAIRFDEHQDELANIEAAGNARVEQLRDELASLPTEQAEAIQKITATGNERIQKLNTDYMQKSLADARKFAIDSRRIAQDRETAITRLAQDGLAALNEAEANNDVISFLRTQKENAVDLKRAGEDARTEEQRRAQDRAAQLQEQAEAQQARISEAIDGINAERQKAVEAFTERQAAIQTAINAEKAATVERLAASEASYQKELERQALLDQRKAEDKEREDARRQEAHDAQLAAIEEQKQAQLAANHEIRVSIDGLTQLTANLQSRIAAANAQAEQTVSSTRSPASSSSPFSGGMSYSDRARRERAGITAFANEGIATRPQLAMVGDKPGYHEAMINFKPSEGLPASLARRGMGGGNNISVSVSMPVTVGDVATQSMLTAQISQAVETVLYDGIAPLIENALQGNT